MTLFEAAGLVGLGLCLSGLATIFYALYEERGLPAHTHEEGQLPLDGRPCPRCVLPPRGR